MGRPANRTRFPITHVLVALLGASSALSVSMLVHPLPALAARTCTFVEDPSPTHRTVCPHANLSGRNLSIYNLNFALLARADLSRANLGSTRLSGASLAGANLSVANLTYADLGDVNLSHADLSGADLSNADLKGATTTGANFNVVTWRNTTCPTAPTATETNRRLAWGISLHSRGQTHTFPL
jgi:hypothetical protein